MLKRWLSPLLMVLFFVLWEVVCALKWVNPVLLSSPTSIVKEAIYLLPQAYFYNDIAYTLGVYVFCLVIALFVGTFIGLLIGYSATCYRLLIPFIVVMNSLPKIALMPLITLWVGIGLWANVLLGALMAGFPIVMNTYTGIQQLEREHLVLARSFGASPWFVFRHIVLPGIIPYVLSGLRVGINYAMVGVLIVEFFASNQGIGYRMNLFMSNFEIDAFFVCLVLIACITLLGTALINGFERYYFKWQPKLANAF